MGPTGMIRYGLYCMCQFFTNNTSEIRVCTHGFLPVVSYLDVVKVTRILECGCVPVELSHPAVDRGIAVADVPDIALEMPVVCDVKPNLHDRM